MVKRTGKNVIKDQESFSDLFKREISSTRDLVKKIISGKRENAKITNMQHLSSRT